MRATTLAVQQNLNEEIPVGYSSAGTVVEVGEHARGLQHGDRVACAGGAASHAEFVAVPANLCVRIPPGVPLPSAAITTIAAIAMHAIRLADVRVGSRVAVIGCGLVGQLALRLLRAAGAETFALDINPQRVRQADAGGADRAVVIDRSTVEKVRAQTGDVGIDEVIVAAAAQSNEPLLLAAEIARDRGSVVLVGAVPIDFARGPLYDKELRFQVSRSYGPGRTTQSTRSAASTIRSDMCAGQSGAVWRRSCACRRRVVSRSMTCSKRCRSSKRPKPMPA